MQLAAEARVEISIHSLARGRTPESLQCYAYSRDFNPLPRKRENYKLQTIAYYFKIISIHSLARGRTLLRKYSNAVYIYISIHSLARGRTLSFRRSIVLSSKFQSTPSQEGEPLLQPNFAVSGAISIHSLARGRTKRQAANKKKKGISIHSLARGRPLIVTTSRACR